VLAEGREAEDGVTDARYELLEKKIHTENYAQLQQVERPRFRMHVIYIGRCAPGI